MSAAPVLHLATTLGTMLDELVDVRTDVDRVRGRLYSFTRLSTNTDVPTALLVRLETIAGKGSRTLVVIPWHAVRDLRRVTE